MPFIAFGINHTTASVEVREQVAFSPDNIFDALQSLLSLPEVNEGVILSTCNRTELYVDSESSEALHLIRWLAKFHGVSEDAIEPVTYCYRQDKAVQHVMEVASGLDSLILGEPQILGQLKQAYTEAKHYGAVSGNLERLFQNTFNAAKRIRTETEIGANAVSVAFAAVQLARHIFSDIGKSEILLIGAGETIELVADHLKQQGAQKITVANRTIARGEELANKLGANVITLSQLHYHLADADIVISSTASQLPLVGKGMVETALKARKRKPMLLIDLAVPRDIEQEVNLLEGAYLYTVDNLQAIIKENLKSREEAAQQAKVLISEHVEAYLTWQQRQQNIDLVKQLRHQSAEEKERLLLRAINQIKDGQSPEEVLQELANKLTNSLLHAPTAGLKQAAEQNDKSTMNLLASLYGLNVPE